MNDYIEIILKYTSYIDWINLLLLFVSIIFFWNWITYLTNFHKRSNSLFEYFIRNLMTIPFWIVFLIYIINFLSPINYYSFKDKFTKEIYIENNTKNEVDLEFYGKGDNEYFRLYNNFENYINPTFTIDKKTSDFIKFDIDTSMIKYLYVVKKDESNIFNYSHVYELNNTKLVIYTDEFSKNPSKPIEVDNSYLYKIILISFFGLIGSWYYYFLAFMKENKRKFLILSIIASLFSITALFFSIRLLFYS